MRLRKKVPGQPRVSRKNQGYPDDKAKMDKYDSKMERRVHEAIKGDFPGLVAERIASRTKPYLATIHLSMNYNPDFVVVLPSGRRLWIECKGHLKDSDKLKLQNLPEFLHHNLVMVVVDANRTLPHRTKMTYREWGEKYKITVISEDELDLYMAMTINQDRREHGILNDAGN